MLRDSAHIQESEAEWRNRKNQRSGKPDYEPVYTMADAEAAIAHLRPVHYGEMVQVDEHFTVRFRDVSHLLGSACIEVWIQEGDTVRKMVFSGDVGNLNQPIIRDVPQTVEEADYVVVESTYGDRAPRPARTAGGEAGGIHPAHTGPGRQRGDPVVCRRAHPGDALLHPGD